MSAKHLKSGILWMALACLSFAVMAAAAKFCGKRIPVAEIILVRSFISSVVIGFLLLKTKGSFIGKNPPILASRGAIGFLALTLYFWAVSKLDLGTAVMLNYTSPIFALLWARLFIHERSTAESRTAVVISFAGVYLLSMPHFHAHGVAIAAGLLSGVLAGSVQVLIRQSHEEDSSLTIIFYFTAICTLGSVILLGLSGAVWPTRGEWLALLVVTLTSLVGQFGLTYSLKCAPVSVVTPFGYLTPIFGSLLGWLLWKESLSELGLFGGFLIIAGGILVYRSLRSWPET